MDIEDIIEAIRHDRLRITDHADEEAQEDRLTFDEIFASVLHGEVIEDPTGLIQSSGSTGVHGGQLMKPFSKCPVCGGEVTEKNVEKLLRGGVNLAAVKVRAEVCLRCGERLYSKDTVNHFQQIRDKLANQEVGEFDPLGRSFQVPA